MTAQAAVASWYQWSGAFTVPDVDAGEANAVKAVFADAALAAGVDAAWTVYDARRRTVGCAWEDWLTAGMAGEIDDALRSAMRSARRTPDAAFGGGMAAVAGDRRKPTV